MTEPIDLAAERQKREQAPVEWGMVERPPLPEGQLVCACGNGWFEAEVCAEVGSEGVPRITGFSVPLICANCGEGVG